MPRVAFLPKGRIQRYDIIRINTETFTYSIQWRGAVGQLYHCSCFTSPSSSESLENIEKMVPCIVIFLAISDR